MFVPRDEITVAASTAEAPAQRTLTAEQLNLLSVTLDGALESFLNGYGGIANPGVVVAPTAGYVLNEKGELAYPGVDTPDDALLYDLDKLPLYKKVDGELVRATVGDMGADVQFYDKAGNEANEWVEAPGNCAADGAVCHDGFTGLAYYVTDNLLPFGDLDNVFWESGLVPFFQVAAEIGPALIDSVPGLERLQLTKRVDEFFAGGAAYVAYSIINDNLPDDAVGALAKGLNAAFYSEGVVGAVKYVVEVVKQLTAPAEPDADTASVSLLSAAEKTEAESETESNVNSTTLPNVSKLLSLPTPKLDIESPIKKLAEQLEAPAESKLAKTLDVKDVEGATEETGEEGATTPVTPAVEVSKPEAPKFELPKLPKLDLNLTPKVETKEIKEIKEPAAEEKSDTTPTADSDTTSGATAGTSNKFAPKARATERKKSAGEKFVEKATKNLEKAFKPTTKAGASKQETAKAGTAGSDTASASAAKAGNAHSGTSDNTSTKDNKDK
ncbi:hypothetical protein BVU76_25305 [Mycolicibacterium porcinum]|nr:hypothetical protein BVU76_25305 [Mycolicibacterium porcinum]